MMALAFLRSRAAGTPRVVQAKQALQRSTRLMSARPPSSNDDEGKNKVGVAAKRKKVTLLTLAAMRQRGEKIAMVTAHDYPSAALLERSGAVDMILVGDSLAMVALGHSSTVSVTVDEMLHHCRAVMRGARTPMVVGDMPFGSYEAGPDFAVRNAARYIKEGGVEAVKLEGGVEMAPVARAIVRAGIPVLGHVGLTPQRLAMLGGFRVQGKSAEKAMAIVDDAAALQDAGCFAVVLEAVPSPVAQHITSTLGIPTIGIGAGPHCSGQVLVQQDMLGIFDKFVPKFCKQYANVSAVAVDAFQAYSREVKEGSFPAPEHTYPMPEEELQKFQERIHARNVKEN